MACASSQGQLQILFSAAPMQVCLAAMRPVAHGHASLQPWSPPPLAGEPAGGNAATGGIVGVRASIAQGFTQPGGAAMAVVYGVFGDGRVTRTAAWPQVRLASTSDAALQVDATGADPDGGLFGIRVRFCHANALAQNWQGTQSRCRFM